MLCIIDVLLKTCGSHLFRQETTTTYSSASRTSETWEPNFSRNIFNDLFLGVSEKKFRHFPQKFHLHVSPKISDDLFLVIDLFRVLICYFSVGGTKSVADIDTGGPKSLHFHKFTMLSLLFLLPRGAKLHGKVRWGAMAGFAPLDPPL